MPAQHGGVVAQELRPLAVLQRLPGVVHLDVEPPVGAGDVRRADRGGGSLGSGERVLRGVPAVVERAAGGVGTAAGADLRRPLPERPEARQLGARVGGVDVVGRAARRTGPDDLLGEARVGVERLAAVDPDDAEVAAGGQRAAALRVGHVVAALAGGQRDRRCLGARRRDQHGAGSQDGGRQSGQRGTSSGQPHAQSPVSKCPVCGPYRSRREACQGVVYGAGHG